MPNIITLDVGTSSMRSVVYDHMGQMLFSCGREYHTEFIYPAMVEQDPHTWRDAAVEVLQETAQFLQREQLGAEAVTITSQRASLIPVDGEGEPLCKAIMWQDKRAIEQCNALIAQVGMKQIHQRTGLRINPYFVLPRMLWLRQNRPELFAAAHKFIGVQDYVVHCLTGVFRIDWTQAARTMLMNIRKFTWDREMLELAGIGEEQLCELCPPGSRAGPLTDRIADLTGLPRGLPVLISGGDQQNAAVALGVLSAGQAEANTGTGSFIITHTNKPVFDHKCRILCSASAVAGRWILEASIFNSGAIYRWFREQYFQDLKNHKRPYAHMDKLAAEVPAGSNGVLLMPHFEGSAAPFWEPMAKGMFFNLSLGTTRADMTRAILEGIAMEIADCLALLETKSGQIHEVTVAGGMAKSNLFAQIQADSWNKRVIRYKNSEASSLGAAMVAMVSLGIYSSIEEAFRATTEKKPRVFLPSAAHVHRYDAIMVRRHKLFYSLQQRGVYNMFMQSVEQQCESMQTEEDPLARS